MKKAAGNIPPLLLDKETLCRKLNIAERTLYRDIKDYNIPVHKLGSRLYFYWEEVEQSLSREKTISEQAASIREEARGNWLQRSWRPIVMLVFTLIILAGTFLNLPILADTSRFWDLLEIGLGGYIIGRGSEQLVSSLLKRPRK